MKRELAPTRRLPRREHRVFEKVVHDFSHLTSADAEQLTQYCEAVIRYEIAIKETKKHPTISIPIVNRSTGNVTGEKVVRNPAFVTVKESLSQMNTLARRLMIDAHSAEKRQRLLTKKAQVEAAIESKAAAASSLKHGISEEQIQKEVERLRHDYFLATEETLRQEALWHLTIYLPSMKDPEGDEIIFTTSA